MCSSVRRADGVGQQEHVRSFSRLSSPRTRNSRSLTRRSPVTSTNIPSPPEHTPNSLIACRLRRQDSGRRRGAWLRQRVESTRVEGGEDPTVCGLSRTVGRACGSPRNNAPAANLSVHLAIRSQVPSVSGRIAAGVSDMGGGPAGQAAVAFGRCGGAGSGVVGQGAARPAVSTWSWTASTSTACSFRRGCRSRCPDCDVGDDPHRHLRGHP